MSKEKLLKATHQGEIPIGDIELPCFVLENGSRVLSGRGIQKVLTQDDSKSGTWLKKFVNSKAITTRLNVNVLEKFNAPLEFKRPDAGGSQSKTYGYEASSLIDLCDAILEDKKSGEIDGAIIARAEIIIRAVAKVGIIALIDEATGYQEIRANTELREFLSKFLNEEAAKWVKRFPDEYFRLMFEMKNWTWNYASTKKPSVVGRYINDQIYSRLAPFVLEELRTINPPDEKGRRKSKHHQWLTEDIGNPKLQEHLAIVMALQRAAGKNWGNFMRLLNRSLPKYGDTMQIPFPEENE